MKQFLHTKKSKMSKFDKLRKSGIDIFSYRGYYLMILKTKEFNYKTKTVKVSLKSGTGDRGRVWQKAIDFYCESFYLIFYHECIILTFNKINFKTIIRLSKLNLLKLNDMLEQIIARKNQAPFLC